MIADVDVIVPVRNGGRLLQRAVDSVLAQKGVSCRVIVVDDGSSDGACDRLRDRRVVVIGARGRGLANVLNTGLELVTAPVVARQDADDESLPGRLEAELTHLSDQPGVGLVATAYEVVVGNRAVGVERPALNDLLQDNPICSGSVAVRASVIRRVGGFRARFALAEDYDCWLRCATETGVSILPFVGYRYRISADQSSIRLHPLMEHFAELARASARARAAGEPDPVEDASETPALGVDDEFTAWWAREFAALGCWRDSAKCLARLPANRAAREMWALVRSRRPQVAWGA